MGGGYVAHPKTPIMNATVTAHLCNLITNFYLLHKGIVNLRIILVESPIYLSKYSGSPFAYHEPLGAGGHDLVDGHGLPEHRSKQTHRKSQ